MTNFNIRYYLCWGNIPVWNGKYTLPAGRQEIVRDFYHEGVDREAWANEQADYMNSIYGSGTHWIETSEG